MWFKNMTIFRVARNYSISASRLEEQLEKNVFIPTTANDAVSYGFSPVAADGLVYQIGNQFLMSITHEKKLLPSSVINKAAAIRAQEFEELRGFKPGRLAMKELKERVTEELMARAFNVKSKTNIWMDTENGWLIIDTAAASKSDDVIKLLLKSVDTFPLESLRVRDTPQSSMTNWLSSNEAPAKFTIDQDAELRSPTESKATIRYSHHSLDPDDIKKHIADGKRSTKLALTWADKVSFILTDGLTIKRIKPLDVLDEKTGKGENQEDRFASDFSLMTGELNALLTDLTTALGGMLNDQIDLVSESAKKAVAA